MKENREIKRIDASGLIWGNIIFTKTKTKNGGPAALKAYFPL
jgi:hypothetical protein